MEEEVLLRKRGSLFLYNGLPFICERVNPVIRLILVICLHCQLRMVRCSWIEKAVVDAE